MQFAAGEHHPTWGRRSAGRQRARRGIKKREARRKRVGGGSATSSNRDLQIDDHLDSAPGSNGSLLAAGSTVELNPSSSSYPPTLTSLCGTTSPTQAPSYRDYTTDYTRGVKKRCVLEDQEELTPMVVEDKEKAIEVHIQPELRGRPGTEVLRLSTEEYFRRLQQREIRSTRTIAILTDRI